MSEGGSRLDGFRAAARRMMEGLRCRQGHHERPVQGTLDLGMAEPTPATGLTGREAESLMCLAIVRDLTEDQQRAVLDGYVRESVRGPVTDDAALVERNFYLALFEVCKAAEWMPVVGRFEELKADPRAALERMGV